MKKILYLLLNVLSLVLVFSENTSLSNLIKLKQINKYILPVNNEYQIDNNNFKIELTNISQEQELHVFISKNEIIRERSEINISNSKLFSLGNSIVISHENPQNGIVLYFDSLKINNTIDSSLRIIENNKTIITVNGFGDLENDNKSIDKLFCTLFVDLNNNKIIESNEIAYMTLFINGAGSLFNKKIYICTTGYYIKNYKFKDTNKYKLYKITSFDGLKKYMNEITENISNLQYWIDDQNLFSNYSVYVLQSPITKKIFLNQPYKFSNNKYLIFDIVTSQDNIDCDYVAGRNYIVKKQNDNLSIIINDNGQTIVPELILY